MAKVTVIHPVLTEEERAKRIEDIKKALVEFYIQVQNEKRGRDGLQSN